MSETELSGHELELLKIALPFAQTIKETEDRLVTQDELREHLKCRSINARNIQRFILASDALKIVARMDKAGDKAEDRAVVKYATEAAGDVTLTAHVLRENARLARALSKAKQQKSSTIANLSDEIKEEIENLKALAKESIKRKPIKLKAPKHTGLMLEINISDAHWGKLAWPSETGGEPYDLKIAEAMFLRAVEVLLERSQGYEFEKILFVLGNDFLHSNDTTGKTSHGTQLDTEGRFQKTYWTARKTMCRVIERLRDVAPVEVAVIYGNHDKTSLWTLADSIECYFHGDDRVKVDNNPTYRKYIHWGNCGLMLTHGDLGKRADFPLLFATEKPDIFGSTTHREIHTGHLHTSKMEEWHGVRVRIIPSLSPADAWHSENGYVGNLRNAEAYVWSKEQGLIAQFIYNDSSFPVLKTERKLV